jgi:hypothetical protein
MTYLVISNKENPINTNMTEDYYDIENYLKDMEVTGIFLPRNPSYSEYNYSNLYSDDDASGDTSEAETDDDDDSSQRQAIYDAIGGFEVIFNRVVSIFPAAGDGEPACLEPLHHPSEIPSYNRPSYGGGVLKNAVIYFLEWPLQSDRGGLSSQRKYIAALEKWRFGMHAACADFGFQTYLQNAMESAVPVPADKQRKNYEDLCKSVENYMDPRFVDTTRVLSLLKPLEKPATTRDFVDVLIPLAEIVLKGKRMTASNEGQFLPYFFIKDCIGLFKDFVNQRRPAWAAVGAGTGASAGAGAGAAGVSRGDEDKSGKGGRRIKGRRLYNSRSKSRSRSRSKRRGRSRSRSSRHRHHTNKKCSIM